jgi:hypothetical protein
MEQAIGHTHVGTLASANVAVAISSSAGDGAADPHGYPEAARGAEPAPAWALRTDHANRVRTHAAASPGSHTDRGAPNGTKRGIPAYPRGCDPNARLPAAVAS